MPQKPQLRRTKRPNRANNRKIRKRLRYEPCSNRGPSERRQKHPFQPPRGRAEGHRRCDGRNHPRPPLRQDRLERQGVFDHRHGRLHRQFGRCLRRRNPPPGAAGHRRSGRDPLPRGGKDRYHRPRHADGRHPAPHLEEGDSRLQQGRQQRPDLLLARVLCAGTGRPLLHQFDVGKRYGRPDGRHPGRASRGDARRRGRRPAPHHHRRPPERRQVVAHERPAGRRAQHRDLDRRDHTRLDTHAACARRAKRWKTSNSTR